MTTTQESYLIQQEMAGDVVNGMDFQQGNMLPLASLLSFNGISTNPYAGIYYVPASNKIVVKQNGAVLSGYNFSGVAVQINANNVTIKNCTFNDLNALITVREVAGFSGMTVQNCTFNGGDNVALAGFVEADSGYATVSNNTFIDTPSHAVQITAGVVSDNSFFGAGFQTACHADAICVEDTTGPVLITGNYVDWTNTYGGVVATNNAVRITTDIGNVSDVTVTNNVLLGGQDTVAVIYGDGAYGQGAFSNVNVSNNYVGDYAFSAYYPEDPAGVTLGSYTDIGFDNPALSAAAWSTYQGNITAVNSLVTVTAGQSAISATPGGSTMLYGGAITGEYLDGGAGEAIMIGGAGTQFFIGGSGKDIYTYLAVADSTTQSSDNINLFKVASDVIDLHTINANPAGAFTNFNFIGSASFSNSGGEIQVTHDVANNQTLVEADLVGDNSADMEIRLSGLLNLTAANFALTTAQYEAAIAGSTTVASFESSQSLLDQVAGGFSIVDTAANAQSDLTALQADAANINAITLIGGSLTVSAATANADKALLNKIAGGFIISDTVANVQANLDALQADVANITSITATGGSISVSTSTFLADQAALNKTAVANLTVTDTSANLGTNLAALQADAAVVDALTTTDSAIAVNIATFTADKTVLNKAVGGFAVVDTAANIQANLTALNADATNIVTTTATAGLVSVNVANFSADQAALNEIAGGFNIADNVTIVQSNLAALQADVAHVTAITALYGSVLTSIANLTADQPVLNEIVGGFKVSDTFANIQANLAALNADGAHILSTTATGGQVNVSIGTFATYQPALDDIVGGFAVTDTVANVQADLAALNADAAHITATTATGGPVSVSTTTFLTDQTALNDIVGGFNISDTSANLQANLTSIQADAAHINALTAATGVVTVNAANFVADKTILNKAVGGFNVTDTAANIQSNLSALQADAAGHIGAITATGGMVSVSASTFAANQIALNDIVGGFTISDASPNLTTNLTALNADASNITSITSLYGTYNTTATTLQADQAVLNKVIGGVKVLDTGANVGASVAFLQGDISNVISIILSSGAVSTTASAFAADQAALNEITTGFSVVDTAANIQSNLSTLYSDVAHVNAITSSSGYVTVNSATFAADRTLLNKIAGTFEVLDTYTNVQASYATLKADAAVFLAVSDTSIILQANLATLQSESTYIDALIATSGVLTTNYATFAADRAVLDKTVGGFAVSDTLATVQTNLATLSADANINAITATGGTVSVNVATFTADQGTLADIVGGFNVSDTAANIQANLAALNAVSPHIDAISATGTVVASAANVAVDAPALNLISGGFNVYDTATNIQANLSALYTDVGHIDAISATGTVVASAANVTADASALNMLAGGFNVSDTAVNIQANLAALSADVGHIDAIAVTGTVVANVANLAANAPVLNMISGGFNVSDTAANIQSNLATLNADIGYIGALATTDTLVTVTAAAVAANAPTLNLIGGGFNVSDTASNIQANLAVLNGDAAHIDAISATGTVTVSVATVPADASVLNLISGGFAISDTATNIQANLAALNADASHIDTISTTDILVTVSAATLAADAPALNMISGGFAISDTAANIRAGLTALNADASHIDAISATGTITVSAATFAADTPVLNMLAGGFNVSDTTANIQASLTALNADVGHIDAISATGTVVTSAANVTADAPVLNMLAGGFNVSDTAANIQSNLTALNADAAHLDAISATGTVVTNVATLAADATVLNMISGGFNVSDTAANIQSNLAALNADIGHIGALASTDALVTVSAASFAANKTLLDKTTGGFMVSDTVANVTAYMTTLSTDTAVLLNVSDAAANLQANLPYLEGKASIVDEITSTSGVVTVNAATFAADQPVLNKIVGGFTVSDTASNILANLAALNADASKLASVTVTSGTVSVNAATLTADQAGLNKIVGGYNISDLAANVQSNLAVLNANAAGILAITATGGKVSASIANFMAYEAPLDKITGGFNVGDTNTAIQSDLAGLNADNTHITTITASSGVFTVTTATFMSDQSLLNKTVGGFMVSDTSTNIEANITALRSDNTYITALSTPPGDVISVSTTTFMADHALLTKTIGGFNISDTATSIAAYIGSLTPCAPSIHSVTATGGLVTASAATFTADQSFLDEIIGGYKVLDSMPNIQTSISALEGDISNISTIALTGSSITSPSALTLSGAAAASDAAVLAKISSPYVLDMTASGTTSVTGYGNTLTINVGAGNGVVTGGGLNDTITVAANFGTMQITDFATHYADASHDTISLSTTDFANWATLLSDGQSSGAGNANTTFTAADGASLTINGVSLSSFQHPSAALQADFKFHA